MRRQAMPGNTTPEAYCHGGGFTPIRADGILRASISAKMAVAAISMLYLRIDIEH